MAYGSVLSQTPNIPWIYWSGTTYRYYQSNRIRLLNASIPSQTTIPIIDSIFVKGEIIGDFRSDNNIFVGSTIVSMFLPQDDSNFLEGRFMIWDYLSSTNAPVSIGINFRQYQGTLYTQIINLLPGTAIYLNLDIYTPETI